jgi:hypothetical protein
MSKNLIPNPKTTDSIERVAIDLGARRATIYQWRRRGVPAAWQIKIVTASKGRIKLKDFLVGM